MKKSKFTFIDWLIELFKDERGVTSIKPIVAMIGMLVLCASLIIYLISGGVVKIPESIINAIMIITIAGMGGDSIDKFSFKKPLNTEGDDKPPVTP